MNIIYVHTHDSGRFFSPYGYSLETPNIQRFADTNHLFNQAFAVAPTCSPSRASLMTSQYPHQNGMIGLCNRGFIMDDYSKHFVHILNNEGYDTVLSGIQHEAAHYNDADLGASVIGYKHNLTTHLNLESMKDKREWDSANTRAVINYLKEKDASMPFFISLGFFGTHRPYPEAESIKNRVPHGFPNREAIRRDFSNYSESVKHVDKCFGELINALKELNIYEETIILFTTDHGIAYPFGKSTLYDLGLEVALILKAPSLPGASINDQLVSQLDIVPTLCDLIGIEKSSSMEGNSIIPLIRHKEPVNSYLVFEMNFHTSFEPARAIRTERYKYIEYLSDYPKIQLSNINESPVKDFYLDNSLEELNKEKYQLFDLYYDPDEKNNLIHDPSYKEILDYLKLELKKWRNKTNDLSFGPDYKYQDEWIINKTTSRTSKGEGPDDFLEDHIHPRHL